MRKRLSLFSGILVLILALSTCTYGCINDGDETIYQVPEMEKTTYQSLVAGSKEDPPQWTYIKNFWILCGEKSFESSKEDVYLEVAAELETVFADYPLYAFEAPQSVKNYSKYLDKLLNQHGTDFMLHIYLAAGPGPNIERGEFYLSGIRVLMLDSETCYVETGYTAHNRLPEIPIHRYVYYLTDEQVIAELLDWANSRCEAQVSS
jgi:hypothetical protein